MYQFSKGYTDWLGANENLGFYLGPRFLKLNFLQSFKQGPLRYF